jgi:hypothetical protein
LRFRDAGSIEEVDMKLTRLAGWTALAALLTLATHPVVLNAG